jgi:DNA-binding beta-propeller fold protein YncE
MILHVLIVAFMMSGGLLTGSTFAQEDDVEVENEQGQYSFAFKWGSNGTGNGQFMRPHGLDFDSQGNVYVTDRDLNNVQKFTSDGQFITKWGKRGTSPGEFIFPYSVLVDKNDNVYVVDKDNHRIQKFSNNGTFMQLWDKFDAQGSKDAMSFPEAMAIDPSSGNVFITDTGNNRTIKLDHNFEFLLDWGSYGTEPGEFDHPHGIGVDSEGNVYINELNVARIQKFDNNGTFIEQWGSEGNGDGEFTLALEHLYVDPSDNIWQVDGADNPRIQKFDSSGEFITSLGGGPCEIPDEVKNSKNEMANYDDCDGRLNQPEYVGVNSAGHVYVVDRGNQRIVVFTPRE